MRDSKINERISAHRVVLILPDGTNKGEMLKFAAIDFARQQGMDLVEVSTGPIPTCRIMDYGKVRYQKAKRDRQKSHAPSNKEVRFSYLTEDHDIGIKRRKVTEFLADGHKVLIFMAVRGRERYVGDKSAQEKFASFVREFAPTLKATDIQENGKGYSFVVHPQPS
jgi:translation initiation factor IF-3